MAKRLAVKLGTWALILVFWPALLFPQDHVSRVDELFSRWDGTETPGCALAIVQDGKIIYKKGYGLANLELGVPITPPSVFYTGSVSKQFVAMSIALLIQEGRMSLDDDIRLYIPELAEYDRPITTRHLIYHTSGIRDYLTLEEIAGIPLGQYHEAEVLELICRQKELNFSPGEEHLYSNSGYFLLAVLVERVSGKSLRDFADELRIKLRGARYTLKALDDTEFRLKNTRQPVRVRFQKRTGMDHSFQMEVKQGGQLPLLFIPAETYAPTSSTLEEYQGEYSSPELPATYILRLRGNRLVFAHKAAPRIFLVPFMPDLFSYGSNRLRFIRDERQDIIGFRINAGRLRSLRFDRSGN
jgi:hypothetical protein